MKQNYCGALVVLWLIIGCCTFVSAHAPLVKVFPMVKKLTKAGTKVIETWYVLLGRNTGKKYEYDFEEKKYLYEKGLFSELAMIPYDIKGGYFFGRNPGLADIKNKDIFTLLSKVTQNVYRDLDVSEKTMDILPSYAVESGQAYFVLLNYDYPLQELNSNAVGAYKDAYLWMEADAFAAMADPALTKNNIQKNTAKIFSNNWLTAVTELNKKLRS